MADFKLVLAIISAVGLSACMGGSGDGISSVNHTTVGSSITPADVYQANSGVTHMETFVDNSANIIAAAGITHRRDNLGRIGLTRGGSVPFVANNAFNAAIVEFQNMYNIGAGVNTTPTESELEKAWILAGGTGEFDTDGAVAFIAAHYVDVLDTYFDKVNGEYQWTPRVISLEDIQFNSAGGDGYFAMDLDDNGKIVRTALFEDDELNEYGWFTRDGNGNDFKKQMYQYEIHLGALSGDNAWFNDLTGINDILNLEFVDENGELEPSEIKTKAIAKLRAEWADFMSSQHGEDPHTSEQYTAVLNAFENAVNSYDLSEYEPESLNLTVTLNGVGKDLDLKYSDFGYADLAQQQGGTTVHTYAPYAGGYAERQIDVNKLTTNATYHGTAIAGIDVKRSVVGDDNQNYEEGMLVRDDSAELTFNLASGTSTLVMNNLVGIDPEHEGDQWYKTTITGKEGDEDGFVRFDFTKGDKTIDEKYAFDNNPSTLSKEFTGDDWNEHDNEFVRQDTVVEGQDATRYGANATVSYYGTDTVHPTEAGVTFGFSEDHHWVEDRSEENHRSVAIYGAFGGKKQ